MYNRLILSLLIAYDSLCQMSDKKEYEKVFCRQCERKSSKVCFTSKRHMRQIQKLTREKTEKIMKKEKTQNNYFLELQEEK